MKNYRFISDQPVHESSDPGGKKMSLGFEDYAQSLAELAVITPGPRLLLVFMESGDKEKPVYFAPLSMH